MSHSTTSPNIAENLDCSPEFRVVSLEYLSMTRRDVSNETVDI